MRLMAGFFLLVGREIKRERVDGRLANYERRRLPVVAAAGTIVPMIVCLATTQGDPALTAGLSIGCTSRSRS